MKQKIINTIKRTDMIGKTITFEENGNQNFTTFFNGVTTTFLFIAISIISFILGKEIWKRENPFSFINYQFVDQEHEVLEFPFIFALSTNYITKFKNSIFKIFDIGIKNISIINGEPTQYDYLLQQECDIHQFPKKFLGKLESAIILYKYLELTPLCFPIKPEFSKIFKDNSGLNQISVLLNIYLCDDEIKLGGTKYDHDKPLEKCDKSEIENYKDPTFKLSYYFIDSNFDVTNFNDPFKFIGNIQSIILDKNFKVQTDFVLSSIELKTDIGWIFKNEVSLNLPVLNEVRFQISRNYLNKDLFNGIFTASNKLSTIYRKYMKIQELMATIGGLFNGILLAIKLIFYDYSTFCYYKEFSVVEQEQKIKKKLDSQINFKENNVFKIVQSNIHCENNLNEKPIIDKNEDLHNIEILNLNLDKLNNRNQEVIPKVQKDKRNSIMKYQDIVLLNLIEEEKFFLNENNLLLKLQALSYFYYVYKSYILCSSKKDVTLQCLISENSLKKFSLKEYITLYYKVFKE